ncbi:hypothetical protein ACFORK_09120 [Paenibacillus sp. GCM10012306]
MTYRLLGEVEGALKIEEIDTFTLAFSSMIKRYVKYSFYSWQESGRKEKSELTIITGALDQPQQENGQEAQEKELFS